MWVCSLCYTARGGGGSHANILNISSQDYILTDRLAGTLPFPPPSQEGRLPTQQLSSKHLERRTMSAGRILSKYLVAFCLPLPSCDTEIGLKLEAGRGVKLFRRADIENGRVLSIWTIYVVLLPPYFELVQPAWAVQLHKMLFPPRYMF